MASLTEIVIPEIISPSGPTPDPLAPCPLCNSYRAHGPEKTAWIHDHCWKCGFRPGTNQAISTSEMRRQYELFKQMMAEENSRLIATDPRNTLVAPSADPNEIALLKAQLAAMQADMADLRAPQVGITSNQAAFPNAQ
jgi:hypothetical protein